MGHTRKMARQMMLNLTTDKPADRGNTRIIM